MFISSFVRNILTLYRFGPHHVSRPRNFGKGDIIIFEADEALVVIRWRLD